LERPKVGETGRQLLRTLIVASLHRKSVRYSTPIAFRLPDFPSHGLPGFPAFGLPDFPSLLSYLCPMKSFEVPIIYRSPLISAIKKKRKEPDKMKKNYTTTLIGLGPLHIYLARHFGFCYGVENAIEIAFRTVEENPGKKIYLLSEMIHNPQVNADLQAHGITFLQDTHGKTLIPFSDITNDDIVLIPAFGTTLEIEQQLKDIGIQTEKYDTTCQFVEKVWNRS